jgi:hypothetical protein
MKDAWDTITSATAINCFWKSGLSSGGLFVGDQNINEDYLPLSEWLKQNEVMKFDHLGNINNFIHADDDFRNSHRV